MKSPTKIFLPSKARAFSTALTLPWISPINVILLTSPPLSPSHEGSDGGGEFFSYASLPPSFIRFLVIAFAHPRALLDDRGAGGESLYFIEKVLPEVKMFLTDTFLRQSKPSITYPSEDFILRLPRLGSTGGVQVLSAFARGPAATFR
jgi:hypothetical protein